MTLVEPGAEEGDRDAGAARGPVVHAKVNVPAVMSKMAKV